MPTEPTGPTGPTDLTALNGPTFAADALERVRRREPLVQCLTNSVVTNVTANALLALGAAPAMVDIPVEAGAFARIASGVLVNLGTPHAEQRAAMREAAAAARESGTPWVLDPVAIGALPVRTALARELLGLGPTVVRGNASEIIALAGAGGGGHGVDSAEGVEAAAGAAGALARDSGAVVAVSGAVDLVTDGERVCRIANGDVLLTRVTGGGCALGAVMAAFAAVDEDHWATTVAAVTAYTVAAELAVERATARAGATGGPGATGSPRFSDFPGATGSPGATGVPADAAGARPGPGSFASAFLDALAAVDGADLTARAVLS